MKTYSQMMERVTGRRALRMGDTPAGLLELALIPGQASTWRKPTSSSGSLSVGDGDTTVADVTSVVFTGATVTDGGDGEADVAVDGGSLPGTLIVKSAPSGIVFADATSSVPCNETATPATS